MTMQVVVASHPSALQHDTGRDHPERPDRVLAVRRGVDGSGLDIVDIESPEIQRSQLAVVHDASYIEMVEMFCSLSGGALDMDTVVSEESWLAALTAAGGVWALIEELRTRSDASGFAISRPPGHHAFRDRAMGFCLFNNIAVSAALLRSHGERVAILDWDVHHGNGTQSILADDPGVLYVSIHQDPFYPFDGHIRDIDEGAAKGTTVNIPLPAGTAGDVYRRAWGELVIPVVRQFEPDWVLISAGFDAHVDDSLGEFQLRSSDFGWLAAAVAEAHPANRVVATLEGGYDLDALEQSTIATLMGLAGIAPISDETGVSPPAAGQAVDRAAQAISHHWKV
jgi:acetoin utilization deacetylase AcuC-like enzyme